MRAMCVLSSRDFDFPLVFAGPDAWRILGVHVRSSRCGEQRLLKFVRLTDRTLHALETAPLRRLKTEEQVR